MDPSLKGSFDVNLNKIERKKKKNIVSFVSQAIVLFFFDKKKNITEVYRSLIIDNF